MGLKQTLRNTYFSLFSTPHPTAEAPVFVIGTGRSGTHYLCSCLNTFPGLTDCFGGRESPWMFHEVARLTVHNQPLTTAVRGYYNAMHRRASPKRLVDQTHPNLWHAEALLQQFPKAQLLAISRNVYSVVYSMQRHEGVSRWIEEHSRYPKPNRFLGVSQEQIELYTEELTDLQRAVFRWCSHEERITELHRRFPESVLPVQYEHLGDDLHGNMARIAQFLRTSPPNQPPPFDERSLHKRTQLSNADLREINRALELYQTSQPVLAS